MQLPKNGFKQALIERRPQIGLWAGLASAYAAEILATTGFDWLVLDAEHSPNDPQTVLAQLQAIAPYAVQPVVRVPVGDTVLIKQYLDIGALTLLVPMVETAEQAAQIVAATRYPPGGVRGVGSALARAARWNQVEGYLANCEREIAVLVQVESRKGLDHLEAIAATEGVDGVFFGPADLAASMGHLGRSSAPQVVEAIERGIATVNDQGKAAGVLTVDAAAARRFLELGALFVAVGLDVTLLAAAARDLASRFRNPERTT